MSKIVEVKCTLEDVNFVVNNIIPADKSTRDIEVTIPIEISNCSDTFKFLSTSDKVIDWRFADENTEEEEIIINPEKKEVKKDTTEEKSDEILLSTGMDLYRFLTNTIKIFMEYPSIKMLSPTWLKLYKEESQKPYTIYQDIFLQCNYLMNSTKEYFVDHFQNFCNNLRIKLSKDYEIDESSNFSDILRSILNSLINDKH